MAAEDDLAIRLAAFEWLSAEVSVHGDVLSRSRLASGFTFAGERIPLLGPQGIFKPRLCRLPLSITSIPGGPYEDGFERGRLLYAYRGTDPDHPDNAGLRRAMREHVPLVLFHRLDPGAYLCAKPVFIVGEDRRRLRFEVQVDDQAAIGAQGERLAVAEDRDDIRRQYVTATFRRRLHQRAFRERVLQAYRDQCALCRLRHTELLDAAHIVADADDEGDPVVPNGLALCKLHHAAFDSFFLTVRPDYMVEVRQSILDETDGPMLLVGLKGFHLQPINLPPSAANRPDRLRLERRYETFRLVS